MLRGLYTFASSLLADTAWENAVGNNLDNLSTPGYKAQQPVIGQFGSVLLERLGQTPGPVGTLSDGAAVAQTVANLAQGPIQTTGRNLDVAPLGGAWLSVRTAAGVRYTQDGALSLSPTGQLVTAQGDPVLSQTGQPITVPAGQTIRIAQDGTVTAGAAAVGRLLLTTFTRPTRLVSQADGLFQAPAAAGARRYAVGVGVMAGSLEGSNVNESTLMTDLAQVQASFQANQTAMTTADQTFGQLLSDLGK